MGVISDIARALPGPLRTVLFPNQSSSWVMGLRGEKDWRTVVGNGGGSSLVESAVQWLSKGYTQSPLILRRYESESDDIGTVIRRHPMLELLDMPTTAPDLPQGHYDGDVLAKAMIASYVVEGDGYALKIRNEFGQLIQLWYSPPGWIDPMWDSDGRKYIAYYNYRAGGIGDPRPVRVQDVWRIRDGIDPQDTRRGFSPIKKVLRELAVDEYASRFTAALMSNFGMPGVVISPEGAGSITEKQATDAKGAFMSKFGGDKVGEPLVMRGATKVQQFGFSPQDLDLSGLRDVPEERVSSVTNIPAAVLGFGTGMHQVKVGATLETLVDQAWQDAEIPLQRTFARSIRQQILPEFETDVALLEVRHDLSRVPVMQNYHKAQVETWTTLGMRGFARRSEVRRRFDLPVTPDDDVYIIQAGVTTSADGTSAADNGSTPPDGGDASTAPSAAAAAEAELLAQEEADAEEATPSRGRRGELSAREQTIVAEVARGRPNKAIADSLRVSERTVERAVSAAMAKLGASSRNELTAGILELASQP